MSGEFDNVDTIKTYVAETGVAGIVPWRTVQREVRAGTLAAVPLEPALVRPVAVVYPRHVERGPLVRAFADYLIEHQPRGQEPAAIAASA